MLFYLEDDPDYNLPERMTADVKNVLNQHKDVFEVRGREVSCCSTIADCTLCAACPQA